MFYKKKKRTGDGSIGRNVYALPCFICFFMAGFEENIFERLCLSNCGHMNPLLLPVCSQMNAKNKLKL
jgi:hypothetical protein